MEKLSYIKLYAYDLPGVTKPCLMSMAEYGMAIAVQ
jgi:hypothetical protein